MKIHRIIITPGEPSGIGPDLIVQLAQLEWPVELIVCADEMLLRDRAILLNLPLILLPYIKNNPPIMQRAGTLTLLPIRLYAPVIPGILNVTNSQYVINTLIRACHGCQTKEFSALVTGPVHKGIINKADIPFTGHTEFFEKYTKSKKAVMMLTAENLRIALATTHVPINAVSSALTTDLLRNVINTLNYDLKIKLGIKMPHILVCGLNPHAGEDGYIGNEEINTIIPVLEEMRKKGIHLSGPISVDTLFQSKYINTADVILAMYHDQGLPILKYKSFSYGVNITLGLPFIRTSVDHGTALDLVGQKKANANSFITAINYAIKIINNIYND